MGHFTENYFMIVSLLIHEHGMYLNFGAFFKTLLVFLSLKLFLHVLIDLLVYIFYF